MSKPTSTDQHFEDLWWTCVEVIEEAHVAMKQVIPSDQDMRDKWVDEESEDCLFKKDDLKSWKDIRKYLWDHYVSEQVDQQMTEALDGAHCWDSDGD